jgi:hypothetical protein
MWYVWVDSCLYVSFVKRTPVQVSMKIIFAARHAEVTVWLLSAGAYQSGISSLMQRTSAVVSFCIVTRAAHLPSSPTTRPLAGVSTAV